MEVIKKKVNFVPRDYQLYYLEKAKEQNVIICLGTGSGKTFITIMLLKDYGLQLRVYKKKAIFLAPTNPLVKQQSDEISKHTVYNTEAFYGELGVDTWNQERWNNEINKNEVLVLTPDIFLTILTKQLISLDQICVIIFDEAHWGGYKRKKNGYEQTGHAYKQIMNYIIDKQYHNKIRIVGTTASVINACFNSMHLSECCDEMERTYNARILGEFDFDPSFLAEPNIIIWLYHMDLFVNNNFKKLLGVHSTLGDIIRVNKVEDEDELIKNRLNLLNGYLAERMLVKPKYVQRMIRDLLDIQQDLGAYPAYFACKEFRKELLKQSKNLTSSDSKDVHLINLADGFLKFCENIYFKCFDRLKVISKDNTILNLLSPKVLRLLDIIHWYTQRRDDYAILIFIEKVIDSFAISNILKELATEERFSHLKPDFFVGVNNDYQNFGFIKDAIKNFKSTIQKFKDGNLNILCTTSVLEEGIDIGKCNLVIRFSAPKTYREFVQSKGRARAKDSFFVIMHDDVSKIESSISTYKRTEEYLNHKFKLSKTEEFKKQVLPADYQRESEEEFIESKTGAQMMLHEAGPYIQRYLIKKGSKHHLANFKVEEYPSIGFRIKLNLQGVTPLTNEVEGKVYEKKEDALNSACLAAIRSLYEMEQLDDHFIPIKEEVVIQRCKLINSEYSKEEADELNFIFKHSKQRLLFFKQISNYNFFKKYFIESGYNLYEIEFKTSDEILLSNKFKIGLLTQLLLPKNCEKTSIYSSQHVTVVNLNLITNIPLSHELLDFIGDFNKTLFKSAIPLFKKRNDLKFNNDKLIFKFVFLDGCKSIDCEQMRKILQFSVDQPDVQMITDDQNIVRAIHTNTNYKLISVRSGVLPSHQFDLKGELISYNEYYKKKYNIVIENQHDEFYKLEKADLNRSQYSIFMKEDKNEEESKSSFDIYIPKELLIISPINKELHYKINSLLPLIYRIKQKIVLKNLCASLNRDVLEIETGTELENLVEDLERNSASYQNDIDDYIYQEYKRKNRDLPYLESSSSSSSEESAIEDDINDYKEANVLFQKTLNMVKKSFKKETKVHRVIQAHEDIVHPSIKQVALDDFLNESLNACLKMECFSDVNLYIEKFASKFQAIIDSKNHVSMRSFYDMEPKLKKRKLNESEDLIKFNFNQWTNENSNRYIIDPYHLLQALTLKSADDGVNLERLEFLGDCFLKLVTCCILFEIYIDFPIGDLNIIKNNAVSNRNLYGISRRKQLVEFLFGDKFLACVNWMPDGFSYEGPTPNCIETPVTLVDRFGFRTMNLNLVDRSSYQTFKPKSISDGIEALIGGVLLTSGMRNACLFMKYLGLYSDDFKMDIDHKQEDWFKQYDPLEHELEEQRKRLLLFSEDMYMKNDFHSLEEMIDYKFNNKALLVQAFKHVS